MIWNLSNLPHIPAYFWWIACGLMPLVLSGCAEPWQHQSPRGPLIDTMADRDATAKRLLVSDGAVSHDKVSLNEEVSSSNKIVVVDFWAPRCGPCKALGPELERLALERPDDVMVLKVNIDVETKVAQHFEVSSIPDMRIFRDGKAVDALRGFHTADQIIERLQ